MMYRIAVSLLVLPLIVWSAPQTVVELDITGMT